MDKGADLNLPLNDFAHQPIPIAASVGNLEIIKILLPRWKCSLMTMNRLYLISSHHNNADILKFLLKNDKNKNKLVDFKEYIQNVPIRTNAFEFFEKCYNEINE